MIEASHSRLLVFPGWQRQCFFVKDQPTDSRKYIRVFSTKNCVSKRRNLDQPHAAVLCQRASHINQGWRGNMSACVKRLRAGELSCKQIARGHSHRAQNFWPSNPLWMRLTAMAGATGSSTKHICSSGDFPCMIQRLRLIDWFLLKNNIAETCWNNMFCKNC